MREKRSFYNIKEVVLSSLFGAVSLSLFLFFLFPFNALASETIFLQQTASTTQVSYALGPNQTSNVCFSQKITTPSTGIINFSKIELSLSSPYSTSSLNRLITCIATSTTLTTGYPMRIECNNSLGRATSTSYFNINAYKKWIKIAEFSNNIPLLNNTNYYLVFCDENTTYQASKGLELYARTTGIKNYTYVSYSGRSTNSYYDLAYILYTNNNDIINNEPLVETKEFPQAVKTLIYSSSLLLFTAVLVLII